jgi:hypothetical protein
LEEIKRICTHIHALIDSERDVAGAPLCPNRQGFADACQAAGIECCALEFRAMENYFSERAVRAALGASHSALGPYQKLNEVSPSWGKQQNWRIAREMSRDELNSTDLGRFLDSL